MFKDRSPNDVNKVIDRIQFNNERTFSGKFLRKNIGMAILFGKESSRRVDPAEGPWEKVTPSLIFRACVL